ncbi:dihydropteroate synthase [Planococcus sp. CP5-4]|uniref:dihydropteroate synthase n=2 Tax=Planococcus TaxID=1372 RepID=UPI001C222380|nr:MULTISPECIES: dihydropteroate synthase [unclassified Planococcus (in: firmicutes)]MBU9674673.1 dihydropteroate synthase [Planococcus sp. CP5-4_YE]MBV0910414.1 dihydropteroate synthase [Planococcus sp. CP5-4_UN]MBW6064897.1 dihydropteroate synthase [Planococcus sp. CP5-4]
MDGESKMNLEMNTRTLVMGILNITPDSFSDGGQFDNVEQAVAHAKQMLVDGADIIDIGGESTRPGHTQISDEQEIARVVPVIRALAQQTEAVISIDTYKSTVARAAVEAGAHIINDVWGAKYDSEIARVAANTQTPIILMHNRPKASYDNFWQEVKEDLEASIYIAREAGVPDEHIWIDPGIGFAKTLAQNVEMMQRLDQFVALGYPVLLGTSRKSFIGKLLDVNVDERLEGSLATVAFGVMKGCRIVRVHDVKETVRTVRMMDVLTGMKKVEG